MTNETIFFVTLMHALRYHDSLNAQMIGASLPGFSLIYMKLENGEGGEEAWKQSWSQAWLHGSIHGNGNEEGLWTRLYKDARRFEIAKRRQVIVVKNNQDPREPIDTLRAVNTAKKLSSEFPTLDWT
eukprot:GHVU01157566.1.p1 GENE.GHVU01157566.1~~GHVU01157566.1.p1  ORF type:complete len:127 (+),score=12.20 GHVU01157566.1:2-382(+)